MLTAEYEVNFYVEPRLIFIFKMSIKLYGRTSRGRESMELNRFAAVRSKV